MGVNRDAAEGRPPFIVDAQASEAVFRRAYRRVGRGRACIGELHHESADHRSDRLTTLNGLAFDGGPSAGVDVDMRRPVLVAVLLAVERPVGAEAFDLDPTMQRSIVTLDASLQHARLVERIAVLEHRVFDLAGVRDATA